MKIYYKKQEVRIIQYKLQKCSGGVIKINRNNELLIIDINNIEFNTIGSFISSKKVYT